MIKVISLIKLKPIILNFFQEEKTVNAIGFAVQKVNFGQVNSFQIVNMNLIVQKDSKVNGHYVLNMVKHLKLQHYQTQRHGYPI